MFPRLSDVRRLFSSVSSSSAPRAVRGRTPFRPRLEALEDRWVPSTTATLAPVPLSAPLATPAAPAAPAAVEPTASLSNPNAQVNQPYNPLVALNDPNHMVNTVRFYLRNCDHNGNFPATLRYCPANHKYYYTTTFPVRFKSAGPVEIDLDVTGPPSKPGGLPYADWIPLYVTVK
jgi:hypothetical protein